MGEQWVRGAGLRMGASPTHDGPMKDAPEGPSGVLRWASRCCGSGTKPTLNQKKINNAMRHNKMLLHLLYHKGSARRPGG